MQAFSCVQELFSPYTTQPWSLWCTVLWHCFKTGHWVCGVWAPVMGGAISLVLWLTKLHGLSRSHVRGRGVCACVQQRPLLIFSTQDSTDFHQMSLIENVNHNMHLQYVSTTPGHWLSYSLKWSQLRLTMKWLDKNNCWPNSNVFHFEQVDCQQTNKLPQ